MAVPSSGSMSTSASSPVENVVPRVFAVTPMNPNPVTPRAIEIVRRWREATAAQAVPTGLVDQAGL